MELLGTKGYGTARHWRVKTSFEFYSHTTCSDWNTYSSICCMLSKHKSFLKRKIIRFQNTKNYWNPIKIKKVTSDWNLRISDHFWIENLKILEQRSGESGPISGSILGILGILVSPRWSNGFTWFQKHFEALDLYFAYFLGKIPKLSHKKFKIQENHVLNVYSQSFLFSTNRNQQSIITQYTWKKLMSADSARVWVRKVMSWFILTARSIFSLMTPPFWLS